MRNSVISNECLLLKLALVERHTHTAAVETPACVRGVRAPDICISRAETGVVFLSVSPS